MAIQDDLEIQNDRDIRWTGTTATYTVEALHNWLRGLAGDSAPTGNDYHYIVKPTASSKIFTTIIELKNNYNIDDIVAEHLYDGSIIQDAGAGQVIYDGIQIEAVAGTRVECLQNGNFISPNFWTTGINADAANGISHRFMIKVKDAGADIDGRRLIFLTREFGNQYGERFINGTSRGINVVGLSGGANDIFNDTAQATVAGWTTITNTTEGYASIDADNDTVNEFYYSEWNTDVYTTGQLYERMKWNSRRADTEDSNTDTGSDFTIGNGTITGQGQSFSMGSNAAHMSRAFADLKVTGAPTGNITAKVYAHTGTFGSTGTPTGAALATSKVVNLNRLTTSYASIEFLFETTVELSASTNYFLTFEYSGGDGSNYVQVRGLATTGTHAGNRAENTGTWAASANDDLKFDLWTSPDMYGIPAEKLRGITHEFTVDTPVGTFSNFEEVTWAGGGKGRMLAINSTTAATKMWIQLETGTAPGDGVTITGTSSGATVAINVTVTERTLSVPFCGASTGSNMIGAYGFGIEAADLGPSDRVTDLNNSTQTPPNNVQFTVSNLVANDDYVIVGPRGYRMSYDNEGGTPPFVTGETLTFGGGGTAKLAALLDLGTTGELIIGPMLSGSVPANDESISGGTSGATADVNGTPVADIDLQQFTLNGALVGAAVTSVVVNETIPSDTPKSGTIRIERDDGQYTRHPHSTWSGSTFTITSHDFSINNASNGNNAFESYIDEATTATSESVSIVYSSDRTVFVRVVTDSAAAIPIKPFETTGTIGSAGGSANTVRTPD